MQEEKAFTLAKIERVKEIFERLEDNAELPLEIEADSYCGAGDSDWQARNALFFLQEVKEAINNLAIDLGARPITSLSNNEPQRILVGTPQSDIPS